MVIPYSTPDEGQVVEQKQYNFSVMVEYVRKDGSRAHLQQEVVSDSWFNAIVHFLPSYEEIDHVVLARAKVIPDENQD
jgi:hypothetical protein